jgi:hypothetical protein
MDVFACQHCDAAPELIVDGRAHLSIVCRTLGSPTLQAQGAHPLARSTCQAAGHTLALLR